MMKIETYAPIIIPTLNRVEHLKRCIRSLASNVGASETDIYISVDYPPSEKYIDGYNQVCQYLNETKDLDSFREHYVFFQKKNLNPIGNSKFLKNKIRGRYRTYIYSEDDNEFSRNFLQYINKGLALFENNPRVISINGLKDTDYYFGDENIAATKLCPAYGMGLWFAKDDDFRIKLSEEIISADFYHCQNIKKLYKKNKYICAMYIDQILCRDDGLFWYNGKIRICDTVRSIYMFSNDMFCIVPKVSKSRTWGNDGTGVNMPRKKMNPLTKWVLDEEEDFDFTTTDILYDIRNDKIGERFFSEFGKKLVLRAMFEYFLFILMGFNRTRIIEIRKKMKKALKRK